MPPRTDEEVEIEVSRLADARGLPGAYEKVREAYWRAVEAGKRPRLRAAP